MKISKERLQQYRALKRERAQLCARLEEIETPIYSPKVQQFNGMPHAPSPTGSGSQQEQLADRTMELRSWYRSKIEAIDNEELSIEKAIDKLEPTARMIIRGRYMDGLSWKDIGKTLHYSKGHATRLHNEALDLITDPEE